MICNCGEKMTAIDLLGDPKVYVCPKCGGTLNISKTGITRWFDKNGQPSSYDPPAKKDK